MERFGFWHDRLKRGRTALKAAIGPWNPLSRQALQTAMDRGARHAVRTDRRAEHPGVLLREHVLPALHLSVSQAARDLAITRQTLHRILAGDAAISTQMAARLERFCGVPSEFWLDCQHRYELRQTKTLRASVLRRVRPRVLPERIIREIGGANGG